jgi:hypothetical protein
LGVKIWLDYKNRRTFFENLSTFCEQMLVEISFSKNTVRQVLQSANSGYGRQFRELCAAYIDLLDRKSDITIERIDEIVPKKIGEQERAHIIDLFFGLGRHGSAEERQKLETKKNIFDKFFTSSDEKMRLRASMYLKIFILIGVTAVILLL